MEYEDQVRADKLPASIAAGSVDASPHWFLPYLTEKQKLYGIRFVQFKGDWRKAAAACGYSAKTAQRNIEEGPAMYAYMTAVKSQLALSEALSAQDVIAGLHRNAVGAAAAGEFGASNRAWKLLGDTLQLFKTEAQTVNFNGDGMIVQISNARLPADDAIDAEYREVIERNNLEMPALVAKQGDGEGDPL